jgi:murein DD-endopeptidase MepM/ murein hydrolase activator NlpD
MLYKYPLSGSVLKSTQFNLAEGGRDMMKPRTPFFIVLVSIVLIVASVGCGRGTGPAVTEGTSSSPQASPESATIRPTSESRATASPTQVAVPATEAASPPSQPCSDEVCVESGYFLLQRPIGTEGRNTIDPTSRYGTYRSGTRDANRGVYFVNSTGTPVLAAADGTVVVAGDDSQMPYGRYRNAYGNLVILKHDLPGFSQPVFTLYAHLSQVLVDVDDTVGAGEEIGLVGMSGDISGSVLYFEVRLGENSYQMARNPELWMDLLPDESGQTQGAIAGRIMDDNGKYINVTNIILERLAGPGLPAIDQIYIRTYSGESLIGQDPFKENFAVGDLPAGEYQISFLMNGMRQKVVEVQPGEVTVVTFVLK